MSNSKNNQVTIAFLSLGFRPFFLGAGLFAALSVLLWMAVYTMNMNSGFMQLSPLHWHAHEMVYGYGLAVIAGFLLTAISNWTGLKTITSYPLLILFLLWALARLMPFIPSGFSLLVMSISDILFGIYLVLAASRPVIQARQWNQVGIISKLALLVVANAGFYLGALGILEHGTRWGTYAGLYLILALILMMARRVIPFFIEKGCNLDTPLINWRWLDISSLILFLVFMISDIFHVSDVLTTLLAGVLAILHGLRLSLWHVAGIWTRPLLWVLYIAYIFIIVGFVLKAAAYFLNISPFLALHAFALGGIGIMSIGMMARVSLGHTGRRVDAPPPALTWVFMMIIAAAIIRVVVPLVDDKHYSLWIMASQCLWIAAFAGFILIYLPIRQMINCY